MDDKWVYDKDSFYDFLGFMIVHAPDFPEEDFFEDDEQLDIEKAFAELSEGLRFIVPLVPAVQAEKLKAIVQQSQLCFQSDDEQRGTALLQELDEMIKQVAK
jgi:hypothetical protein